MRKFLLFTIFCSFSIFHVQGQAVLTVKGTIKDSLNSETIVGALVRISTGTPVTTDVDGKFTLQAQEGENLITVEAVGYRKYSKTINATAEYTIEILLVPQGDELETVVVSVGKYEQKLEEVTVSMDVLKPTLLENKNTVNAQTIMEQVPGVTVQDGQVSMRGGSGYAYGAGSRVLLLVDDMPMLSGDAGDIKWNALPVENIEQIEVMKGASSVLYGSGALNGVVHVRTAYPRDVPETKINLTQGMYGDPQRDSLRWWSKGNNPVFTGLYFMHSRKIKQVDLVAGGAFYDDGGFREGETEQRVRGNLNLRYRPRNIPRLNFGVNGGFQRARGGLFIIWQDNNNVYRPSGGANPDSAGSTLSRFNNDRYNIDPYLNYFTKKGNKHSLRMRLFNTTNRNATDTVNQNSNSNILYGEYQYQHKINGDWHWVSGVAGFYNEVKSYLYGDHNGTNLAGYTQLDKKFFKRLNVSAGVRLEYYEMDGKQNVSTYKMVRHGDTTSLPFQPVFRAGANYQLFKATFLRASFGQGYRFPSVAERYVTTSVGSLKLFSNPNLTPEYGWSAEGGIKQVIKIGNWKGYVDAAYFYTRYNNMTEFTWGVFNPSSVALNFNPGTPGYLMNWVGFRAQNAEKAQISGVELELVGTGKIGQVNITTLTGYTYMNPITLNKDSAYRATFSDPATNMLKYRFKHLFKADVQVDYKIVSAGVSVRYNSYMVNVDQTFYNLQIPIAGTNSFINLGDQLLKGFPAYRNRFHTGITILDARIFISLCKTTKLGIIVNNLMNVEYMGRPGDVRAPRNIAMQINIKF